MSTIGTAEILTTTLFNRGISDLVTATRPTRCAAVWGRGIFADAAAGLQGIETWLNAHPALMSLVQNAGSVERQGPGDLFGNQLWLQSGLEADGW